MQKESSEVEEESLAQEHQKLLSRSVAVVSTSGDSNVKSYNHCVSSCSGTSTMPNFREQIIELESTWDIIGQQIVADLANPAPAQALLDAAKNRLTITQQALVSSQESTAKSMAQLSKLTSANLSLVVFSAAVTLRSYFDVLEEITDIWVQLSNENIMPGLKLCYDLSTATEDASQMKTKFTTLEECRIEEARSTTAMITPVPEATRKAITDGADVTKKAAQESIELSSAKSSLSRFLASFRNLSTLLSRYRLGGRRLGHVTCDYSRISSNIKGEGYLAHEIVALLPGSPVPVRKDTNRRASPPDRATEEQERSKTSKDFEDGG
ncbi:hypothetical protein CPC08DRAFT_728253 [Agrocybe pediades]|nr:hypothetical protein CPC08DRAFT_728253 [Agrocybe pediades]